MSGSELLGKPVSEVLEWLFPLFDDLTQLLCKRDDVANCVLIYFELIGRGRKAGVRLGSSLAKAYMD